MLRVIRLKEDAEAGNRRSGRPAESSSMQECEWKGGRDGDRGWRKEGTGLETADSRGSTQSELHL